MGCHGITHIAHAVIPGGLKPGLRVGRINQGKRLTKRVVLEFSVSVELGLAGVFDRRLHIGLKDRKIRCRLDGNLKISGLDHADNLRRQHLFGNLHILFGQCHAGRYAVNLRAAIAVRQKTVQQLLIFVLGICAGRQQPHQAQYASEEKNAPVLYSHSAPLS